MNIAIIYSKYCEQCGSDYFTENCYSCGKIFLLDVKER